MLFRVNTLQSKSYLSIAVSELLAGREKQRVFLYCELPVEGNAVSTNGHFFEPYKNSSVPHAQMTAAVMKAQR